jgi:hypothetical protein
LAMHCITKVTRLNRRFAVSSIGGWTGKWAGLIQTSCKAEQNATVGVNSSTRMVKAMRSSCMGPTDTLGRHKPDTQPREP